MKLDESIILTIHYTDKQMIAGRTLLQKTLYFLNEKLDLGIEFAAHYYGPYSASVTDTISSLCASDIITEAVETFEPFKFGVTSESRRYTYQLTSTGQTIAKSIRDRNQGESQKVSEVLELMKQSGIADDYKSLSVAAKMRHILTIDDKPMTSPQILDEAQALGWNIANRDAEAAVDFLANMGLVSTR